MLLQGRSIHRCFRDINRCKSRARNFRAPAIKPRSEPCEKYITEMRIKSYQWNHVSWLNCHWTRSYRDVSRDLPRAVWLNLTIAKSDKHITASLYNECTWKWSKSRDTLSTMDSPVKHYRLGQFSLNCHASSNIFEYSYTKIIQYYPFQSSSSLQWPKYLVGMDSDVKLIPDIERCLSQRIRLTTRSWMSQKMPTQGPSRKLSRRWHWNITLMSTRR